MTSPNADGPDLSHWNRLTGVPFDRAWQLVSLKCSEGERSGDKTFSERWLMLRAAGIKYRGAYHWLRSDSPVENQVANLCARIDAHGGLQPGEFVQCDWETTPGIGDVSIRQVEQWVAGVNTHFGRECTIVYGSDWVPGFIEWRQRNPDIPVWYANYNRSDLPTGGWAESAKYDAAVWQWTSQFVHSSVVGKFDMNHVFDWATLDRLTTEHGDDMTPLDIPERIFDSRDTYEFRSDETRTIPVGSSQAFLHVTLLSSTPGYVSISGSDIRSYASLVNADVQGGIATGGAPILLPDGNVRIYSKSGGHVIVDVYARG